MSNQTRIEAIRAAADTLFTPNEAATFLTLSRRTLDNWRQNGGGPVWIRLGLRRVAYPRSECEAWMTEQRCKAVKNRRGGENAITEAA